MISPFWSFLSDLTLIYQIKVTVIHLRSIFSVSYPAVLLLWRSFTRDSPKHGGAQLRRHWPLGFLKPKKGTGKVSVFLTLSKNTHYHKETSLIYLVISYHVYSTNLIKSANTYCILIPHKALHCPLNTYALKYF